MRTSRGLWLGWALAAALWAWVTGTGAVSAQDRWVGGSPLRTRVTVGDGGDLWVGVWVDAPMSATTPRTRAPMAVSLVIDQSGSMAGEKIRNAQMAASSLLESLSDGDIVSIYGFSSGVVEIAPPTVMSAATRPMLMAGVTQIVAGGGTNLWAGMQSGIQRMSQAPQTHPLRRIFLISDGHANIGPSDTTSLANLAAGSTEWGTQITAIGVGYDYDPQTLQAMVVRSQGRLHHLGAPHQMAAILQQEIELMTRSVALSANVEIVPATGVTIVSGATTGIVIDGNRLRFPLGALYAGQRREILFRVRVDTAQLGDRPLATARLVYESAGGASATPQVAELRYEVARSGAAAEAPRVAAMVAQYEASEAQRAAAEMMARGEREAAVARLDAAQRRLESTAGAVSSADAEAGARLRARAGSVASDRARASTSSSAEEMRERSYELAAEPMTADGY